MISMKRFTVVTIYNDETDEILLVRDKGGNEGNCDFICGELRHGESGLECAHRMLYAETGMDEGDITLQRVLDYTHVLDQKRVQVFAGAVSCYEDLNSRGRRSYVWVDINGDHYSDHEYIDRSCLDYILSSLHYNRDIGLFEGTDFRLNRQDRHRTTIYTE